MTRQILIAAIAAAILVGTCTPAIAGPAGAQSKHARDASSTGFIAMSPASGMVRS